MHVFVIYLVAQPNKIYMLNTLSGHRGPRFLPAYFKLSATRFVTCRVRQAERAGMSSSQ